METKPFQQTLTSPVVISQYLADDLLGNQTHTQIKVHSVFPNGFNLELKGQLIFIGKHGADLSAFGLTIAAAAFSQLHSTLLAGQRVRITPTVWTFYTRPTLIQLFPSNFKKIAVDIVRISLDQLKASRLSECIKAADVFSNSGFYPSNQSKDLLDLLDQWQQVVRHSGNLVQPDLLRQFIGAGIGLTPSGDDFLQGMLLIEQAIGQSDALAQCVQHALQERSTTDVSLAYYHALFAGKVNTSWVNLLTAVKEGDQANLKAAVHQIQAYGATSGNDILLGIWNVLKFI